MTVPTNETLLVVDGHSLAFRAFFALPVDNFSTSSGQATNAVWGFATMLAQVIDAEKPLFDPFYAFRASMAAWVWAMWEASFSGTASTWLRTA